MEGETRRCPWCAESIDAAAQICPFCDGSPEGPAVVGLAPGVNRPSGTAPLVWGIIGLVGGVVFCFLLFCGPIAWWLGAKHERECKELGVEPEGAGKTGKILGIIATILLGLYLILIIGFFTFFIVTVAQSSP